MMLNPAYREADALERLADDNAMLEVARLAIEDALVEFRDSRLAVLRNNGLVIKEKDGTDSYIIRFGPENAMSIGLRAIAAKMREATT